MLNGVECYYAECLLGIAPLYQVVFVIGILVGLVHESRCGMTGPGCVIAIIFILPIIIIDISYIFSHLLNVMP